MEEKMKVKIIYKKSLFVELVRRHHNFLYTTPNRENRKFQCFMFEETEELNKDLAELTGNKYERR
ncbi:hypothetical protein [Peribacillus frigoritolerans]|uniref:hypothetical protein n=1 Tax=Peribacillus frigoritolerans TaxID=450367 RepID=UPI0024166B6B|nr:hypothetical protein [Peribacillus frigoritolerans]MDG4850518.1 hypothetical protein [Peribacillus frigoritolerans]